MITIKTFADVVNVAKTFGRAALDHIVTNNTLTEEANNVIFDCLAWAANQVVSVESVNDGNREYEVNAIFQAQKMCGEYVTFISDVTIIRLGYAPFTGTVDEAIKEKVITPETLKRVLKVISDRNDAAKAFAI